MVTTPRSASAASCSRGDSDSASPSRGRLPPIPGSSSSMKPPARSITRASGSFIRTCAGSVRAAPSSSSRTGSPRCARSTASSPSSAGASSRTAATTNCSASAVATPCSTVPRSASMKSAKLIPLPTRTTALVPRDRSRTELEFLPAALEIVETPASPAGRAIGAVIILFFISALAWAIFGHIEIVATAPGKIIPTSRTKIIQPLEIGTVRAIHVQEGQTVRAGEVLVSLDPTTSEADRNRQAGEFLAARLDVARLSAMVAEGGDAEAAFVAPPDATTTQLALARQFMTNPTAEHRGKLAELDRQKAQSEANRATVAANVEKLNAIVPLLRQRFEMRAYLYDKQYGPKLNYLDAQQELVDKENELEVQKSRFAEAEATLQVVNAHRVQSEAEFRRLLLADLTTAQDKADTLAQELVQADPRLQRQTMTRRGRGLVQRDYVHPV